MTKKLQGTETIICDIGASTIKVGVAGRLVPDAIIPSLAGSPRINYNSWKQSSESKVDNKINDSSVAIANAVRFIGDEAITAGHRTKIIYEYVFQEGSGESSGKIHWPLMEQLLVTAFTRIGIIDCSSHKVLLSRPHSMTKHSDMTILVDMFLVTFGFSAITMHEQAALVLYTQGIETGVVVEVGESTTQITPVYKGHAIPKINRSLKVGGRILTAHMLRLLRQRGFQMSKQEDLETCRQIKEKMCYVPLDVDSEKCLAANTTVLMESFRVSNGTTVSIAEERFLAVEPLFKPSLLSIEDNGLAEAISGVIQEADIDIRKDLCNIILSGGSSLLPGLSQRLEQDLNLNNRSNYNYKVNLPTGKHLVFEGGSLFADLISHDPGFWVQRDEYLRGGIKSILAKCVVDHEI